MRRFRDALPLAGCLMLMASVASGAQSGLAKALLAGIAKAPPVSTPFVQVSYRGVLVRPLVVSGTLRWFGGDHLERDITQPFRETAKIGNGELSVQRGTGAVQRIPLARAPQVGAMLAGFRALLGGDVAALANEFALGAEGNQAHWVITLTPRASRLKRQLASIVIDGRGQQPRCLTVTDRDGDSSITLVGPMATRGLRSAAPLESALAARCRNLK